MSNSKVTSDFKDSRFETIKRARQVLDTCLTACNSKPQDYMFFELKALIESIIENTTEKEDFTLEFCGGECRLIDENYIDEIWTESLIDQVKECNESLGNLPDWVEIDWNQTADNMKELDGKGHHFARCDGEEHFCNEYFIFRTD